MSSNDVTTCPPVSLPGQKRSCYSGERLMALLGLWVISPLVSGSLPDHSIQTPQIKCDRLKDLRDFRAFLEERKSGLVRHPRPVLNVRHGPDPACPNKQVWGSICGHKAWLSRI